MNRSRLGQQLRGGGPLGRVLVQQAFGQRQHRSRGQRPLRHDRVSQRRAFDVSGGQPRHRTVNIRIDHR
jgi:hypothetical protein